MNTNYPSSEHVDIAIIALIELHLSNWQQLLADLKKKHANQTSILFCQAQIERHKVKAQQLADENRRM